MIAAKPVLDPEHGTHESVWAPALQDLRPFDLSQVRSAAVLAPHPDDEVLALGGTMALLARASVPLTLIAVTDGEASHPGVAGLAERRAREREEALARLACEPHLVRLHISDGQVASAVGLTRMFESALHGTTHVFAPLELDGHPDHDAVGEAARVATASLGATLVRYAVWAWHWAQPKLLPLDRAAIVELPDDVRRQKRRALAAYRSQTEVVAGTRILSPAMLAHFDRTFETVFV